MSEGGSVSHLIQGCNTGNSNGAGSDLARSIVTSKAPNGIARLDGIVKLK